MANAAYSHDREDEARSAMLRQWGLDRPRPQVIPIRKPLGLGIVADDDDPPERGLSPYDGDSGEPFGGYMHGPIVDCRATDKAVLDAAADHHFVYFALNVAAGLTLNAETALKERIARQAGKVAELQLENAQLKAALAALTAKVDTLTFISERLRVENKGPAGERGPMGRDGHDGAPGPRGERGEPGRPPTIVAWTTDDANFVAWPVFSNGVKATAGLYLRGMFETYDSAVDAAQADEEADAAASQRAVIEREAEARRLGLPR